MTAQFNSEAEKDRIDFDACFTVEQALEFARKDKESRKKNELITMFILAMNSDQIKRLIMDSIQKNPDGDTIVDIFDQISDYEEYLKCGLDLAKAATARLLLASQQLGIV